MSVSLRKRKLEATRDAKRRQLEALFEQHQAIQNQMQALEKELLNLDDEIDRLEEQGDEEDSQTHNDMIVDDHRGGFSARSHSQEELTDPATVTMPMTLTMHPDEILTDLTQTQAAVAAAGTTTLDDSFQEASSFPPVASAAGTNSLGVVAPLQLARVPPAAAAAARTAAASNNSTVATTADPVVHRAAPPVGFERTSRQHTGTLDSYFKPQQPAPATTAVPIRPQARPQATNSNAAAAVYPWSQRVDHLLHNTFRLQSFRDHQRDIIDATLSGEDVFVIMRTGGGKSLTYQLPALLESNKITLVISPLISLIRDQEGQMNSFKQGSAVSFTSNMGREEHTRRWNLVRDPNSGVVMVLVTPEKIHKSNKLKGELEKLFRQGRLGRFVVDECHCASSWGHDFRPDYTKLGVLKTHFPSIPILAVTATASERVRNDVVQIMRMSPNYRFFRSSARRPNLTYHVRTKTNHVLDDMADFIHSHHPNQPGIVYTFSRKDADSVADALCERGIVARSYHSSVNDSQKDAIHRSWMSNNTQVVVATIAFGLGIHKPDVRFVLHHSLSKSLEAYYQESGRAGRDGQPASCVLWYAPKDVPRMICLIHGDNGEVAFWQMVRYAQAAGNDAVCKAILMASLAEPDTPPMQDVLKANDGITTDVKAVGKHAQIVTRLLQYKIERGEDITIAMLIKEWRSKSDATPQFVKEYPPGKELTVDECERVIVCLLLEDIISPNVMYTAYAATMYLKLGPLANQLLASPNPTVNIRLPKRPVKGAASNKKKKAAATKATPSSDDGWFDTKPKAKRKRSSTNISSKRTKSSNNKKSNSKKAHSKRASKTTAKAKKAEVIELDLSSSSSEEEEEETENSSKLANTPARKAASNVTRKLQAEDYDDLWDDEDAQRSESEYEFEM